MAFPLAAYTAAVRAALESDGTPGAAIAIHSGGHTPIICIGRLRAGGEVLVNADTLFGIGSLSKAFAAAALARRADAGRLSLADPVAAHVPGFVFADGPQPSVRDILTGRTGLSLWDESPLRLFTDHRAEMVAMACRLPRRGGPGFTCSNAMYAAAGLALDRLRPAGWAGAVREMLLGPLAMARTTADAATVGADGNRADHHIASAGRCWRCPGRSMAAKPAGHRARFMPARPTWGAGWRFSWAQPTPLAGCRAEGPATHTPPRCLRLTRNIADRIAPIATATQKHNRGFDMTKCANRQTVLLAIALALMAAPAWAQQATVVAAASEENAEEIIVTGLKDKAGGSISVGIFGDRSLLDTPFSVQGFERNLLDQRIARGLRQVLDNDPSVQFETTAGSYADTLIIRGFSVSNFYLDGFSGPASSQPNLTLDIVDRIEVLRGPSALVFGGADAGGGVGGAVNYIPKRAPTEGRIGSATLGLEGRSSAFITGDIGGRIGKDGVIGYRLVGSYQNGELVANDHNREVLALLASFNVRASDRLSFTLDIAHFDEKQDGYQDVLGIPGFALPAPPNPSRNIANPWTEYDTLRTYGILKADWEFADDWTLSAGAARTRYRNYYFGGALVELIAPVPGQPYRGEAQINPGTSDGTIDTVSGYGRLRGKFNTAGITHDLTVSARLDQSEASFPFSALTGPLLTNIYNPIVSPRPQIVPGSQSVFAYDLKTQTVQVADFIGLTNRLTLLAGAGYVRIKEETIGYDQGRVSPIGAVLWKPVENVSLYASYAEALDLAWHHQPR